MSNQTNGYYVTATQDSEHAADQREALEILDREHDHMVKQGIALRAANIRRRQRRGGPQTPEDEASELRILAENDRAAAVLLKAEELRRAAATQAPTSVHIELASSSGPASHFICRSAHGPARAIEVADIGTLVEVSPGNWALHARHDEDGIEIFRPLLVAAGDQP